MEKATEPRRSARDRILDTAAELFYRDGIRAVGIDTVIARSGVAKMSLYRNFASKDDLICAYLERSGEGYARWWQRMADRYPNDPKAFLKGIFVSISHWIAHPDFRGCPFTNAATELRDPDSRARALAVAQKRAVRDRLRAMAVAAGAAEPDQLAAHLQVLMEGAYAAGHTLVIDGNADAVASAAAALIDAACGTHTD